MSISTRWAGVGHSDDPDPTAAARCAAAEALANREPALVMVFASSFYDFNAVAAAVRGAVGDATEIVGCTTCGEIADLHAGGNGLVVLALGGEGLTVRTASASLADGPRSAGMVAASGIPGMDKPHRALILLSEGLVGERSELVRGAYSVTGAGVSLVGGCSGDDLRMQQSYQLHGDTVLTGGVVGAAIGSDAPIGVGIGHGWRRVGDPFVVTQSTGDRVLRLDDEPALDAYAKMLGAPADAHVDGAVWQSFALLHPLGLPRPAGEEVRAAMMANFEDRSIFCGDVPQGTMLWLMEGDAATVLAGTDTACEEALAMLDGHEPMALIAFDCAARRNILGEDGVRREMEAIARHAPGVPVGGFYTMGEIARTRGSRGVHNATLVLVALA